MPSRTPRDWRTLLTSDRSATEPLAAPGGASRYRRTARGRNAQHVASGFWQSPLPLAIVAVGAYAGFVWWRKKKEAESLQSIQGLGRLDLEP